MQDMAKTRTAPCMHLLPCGIEASGRAMVAEYFEPIIQPEDNGPAQLTTPYVFVKSQTIDNLLNADIFSVKVLSLWSTDKDV